ncbi:transcriptional regulator, HxlR family [Paenibacillus algorifonticola]|uniref:Transcriptional regulator, HxlR family n=1 Tax=Paenibacillus algorifonticola TaxID=684063 RepID=A0A1I2F9I6_9BACL|nr:winged helix-turn-helix transcriptional regulator [Paenibacillus algorifonticola]SFF01226.1 transcriptional regulator, HxlR family [Paenibacillus algorifonticola]
MIEFNNSTYRCTSEIVLRLISGKWKIINLTLLSKGALRFNELQRQLPDAMLITGLLRDEPC